MSSLNTVVSLAYAAVITAIIFAVGKWSNTKAESKADKNKNVCASCGIAEGEEIKLEDCNGCDLVRYCSDKCREEHQEQHRVKCRKRAKKLHDKILFRQPDSSYLGECPICFLPMPIDPLKSTLLSCCSKIICNGCDYADSMSSKGVISCPFCRGPVASEKENLVKRVKANDPVAMGQMGKKYYSEDDYGSAFEYLTKAAELGDLEAHFMLGSMYERGDGVEKDQEKAVYHLEKAAIGGHPEARGLLADIEEDNGHAQRAVKHLIIAAKLGDERSMKVLWSYYSAEDISKKELEAVLRSHHAAVDEMKSPEREAAEAERAVQDEKEKKKKNGRRGKTVVWE